MSRRMVAVEDLAGVAEVARALGRGRTTVTQWSARRATTRFPAPVTLLAMGPVYDLGQVERWYAQYEPSTGGRPAEKETA